MKFDVEGDGLLSITRVCCGRRAFAMLNKPDKRRAQCEILAMTMTAYAETVSVATLATVSIVMAASAAP